MKHLALKLVLILVLSSYQGNTQILFYSDIFHGGVTGNGAGLGQGSGTINMNVMIAPGSTIRKAFLIAVRENGIGFAINVTLNNKVYIFSDSTIINDGFVSFLNPATNWDSASIHVIEITKDLSPTVDTYSLFIPPLNEDITQGYYSRYYLYILYENPDLPLISCSLFLNNSDVAPIIFYDLKDISPIITENPVSLTLCTTHFCDTIEDGSFVSVNGNTIGLIGGNEFNTPSSCSGLYSNYSHFNNELFALDDDTADSLMLGTDGLADIKSYVNNGDTTLNITFTYQSDFRPFTNPIRAVMLSYSTPCEEFTTSVTDTTTICLGEELQLLATGGFQYTWWPATGLSDTTIANPIASPQKTTNYTVIIKNDSGCVKTEHVRVSVQSPPVPEGVATQNSLCAQNNGSITVGSINTGSEYTYSLNGEFQSSAFFDNLPPGNYNLQITDTLGCAYEQNDIIIEEINNISAAFDYDILQNNPTKPLLEVPVTVQFNNLSQNANQFAWDINNQQLSAFEPLYTFTDPGVYPITLISTFSEPHCSDTALQILEFVSGVFLEIPNIFTPNKDEINDVFAIEVGGIKTLEIALFNRWGRKIKTEQFNLNPETINEVELWDGIYPDNGEPAPYGVYFYTIIAIDKSNQRFTRNGNVQVVR
ncbi:MAG: hypothetical protein DRI54_04210 [Bacteroidetes bacterium]|nr:MAG: hypothetical protein DRI54_04210 [Bacteroidota bacterium]